jgi:hypothetical protein
LKVFISFSKQDLTVAQRLYTDLRAAGATVFQWGKTDRFGEAAWEQVLDWIEDSDVFVVLLSQSALQSDPVKAEISHAHYAHVNSKNPKKPAYLVPAILEKNVIPPTVIRRFATLDLLAYESGLSRLLQQLNLKSVIAHTIAPVKLPDFEKLFSKYIKKVADPDPVALWSREAETILTNYEAVKPPGLKPEAQTQHINSLLAGEPSKFDYLFLGLKPQSQKKKTSLVNFPLLKDKLLSFDSSNLYTPLEAPTLSAASGQRLTWTSILDAVAYVLEEKPVFTILGDFQEVYRGPATEYRPNSITSATYRVKATGGVFRLDSLWSNSESLSPPRLPLAAPQLSFTLGLNWTKITSASGYVLERSSDPLFLAPEVIYEGEKTLYFDLPAQKNCWYRVKAKGSLFFSDSSWSNTVENNLPRSTARLPLIPDISPSFALGKPSFVWAPKLTRNLLTLTWTEVVGASSYVLERCITPIFPAPPQVVYEGKVTSYSISAFDRDSYRVKAKLGLLEETLWSEWVGPN